MVAVQAAPVTVPDVRSAVEAEVQRLAFRLEDGFEKIARSSDAGDDVRRWEDVWIQLLREYERLHDRLRA